MTEPSAIERARAYANLGELEREDAMAFAMLAELHANVPEVDRPKSWSDLSVEQAERARKAVRAVVALITMQPSRDMVLEEAARIAETLYRDETGWHSFYKQAGERIAAAIRALKGTDHA